MHVNGRPTMLWADSLLGRLPGSLQSALQVSVQASFVIILLIAPQPFLVVHSHLPLPSSSHQQVMGPRF